MNLFNGERKLFPESQKLQNQNVGAPAIHPPLEITSSQPTENMLSHNAHEPQQGMIVFTNRATLFATEQLQDFFAQISMLINGEKGYGHTRSPETICAQFEQGLSVIGVYNYQVWGHVCLYPTDGDVYVLEVVLRLDVQSRENEDQLVRLFLGTEVCQGKDIYALSWTDYARRLFRACAFVHCRPEALEPEILDALKTHDEFVELYDIFARQRRK